MVSSRTLLIALGALLSISLSSFSASPVEAAGFPAYRINDGIFVDRGSNKVGELAYGENDRIHAVWSDSRLGSNNMEIYYSYSEDLGYSWSTNIRITNVTGNQLNPRLAVCGNKVAVVWQNPGVQMAVSSNNGVTWSTPKSVSSSGENPDIAMGYGCKMSVVYRDIVGGQANIMYRRSVNDGNSWTSPVSVDHTSAATNLPRIFIDPNNHVHVGWFDTRSFPYNKVYYNFSTNSGSSWQAEDILISHSDLPEEGVTSTVDFEYGLVNGQNTLMAVWTSGVENESFPFISKWTGLGWSTPVRVSNSYGDMSVATNANIEMDGGRIVVLWDHDLLGQRGVRYALSFNGVNFFNEGQIASYSYDPTFFGGGIHVFKDGVMTAMFHDTPNVYSAVMHLPDMNLAFVTSQTYSGNLGGLAGADCICQARAI